MLARVIAAPEVVLLLLSVVFVGVPAFVVGQRRGVEAPGIAFVPYVGAWIVILRSIGRSGWLAVLALIPIVALGLYLGVRRFRAGSLLATNGRGGGRCRFSSPERTSLRSGCTRSPWSQPCRRARPPPWPGCCSRSDARLKHDLGRITRTGDHAGTLGSRGHFQHLLRGRATLPRCPPAWPKSP